MHGAAAPEVKAAAAGRLRALVDPALGVLEYAMKGKDKDLVVSNVDADTFRCRSNAPNRGAWARTGSGWRCAVVPRGRGVEPPEIID